jgi:hypothetical protein
MEFSLGQFRDRERGLYCKLTPGIAPAKCNRFQLGLPNSKVNKKEKIIVAVSKKFFFIKI